MTSLGTKSAHRVVTKLEKMSWALPRAEVCPERWMDGWWLQAGVIHSRGGSGVQRWPLL